jgi:hypothetical protein
VPVAGEAAFGKDDDLNLLRSRLAGKTLDGGQIRGLVAGGVLKLHGSNTDVAHGSLPFV